MSRKADAALKPGNGYLQSPVDDIESFLWVMVYAIVYNSEQYNKVDIQLVKEYKDHRVSALGQLKQDLAVGVGYHQLTSTLVQSEFFERYIGVVDSLIGVWQRDCASLEGEDTRASTLCYAAATVGSLHVILRVAVDALSSNSFNS